MRKKEKKQVAKKTEPSSQWWPKLLLPAIIVITALIYSASLNNSFTNWDDDVNLTQNAEVRAFHGDSLRPTLVKIFSVNKDVLMYSPLTKLSYCIQYHQSQLNAWPYHFVNLLLHLLNCALVFGFIWLLTGRQWVAFITALLFAIHPMHVESVAWLTGRIDLLYSFFYIAALCTYVLYLKNEKWRWQFYALTFLLFVLAMLSKVSAVTFPVAVFAVDYFVGRKINFKTVLEKTPFLILAFIFGCVGIYAQTNIALTNKDIATYKFFDYLLFSSYAMVMYISKLLVPVNLSCFYSFPAKQPNGGYPIIVYLSPLVIPALGYLLYKLKSYRKAVLFGVGFFLINVVLTLPGLAPRNAIIADRYSYLSYIGLFLIAAIWLNDLWEDKVHNFQFLKTPSKAVFTLLMVVAAYLTVQACYVWHDSFSLWGNAIAADANCAQAYHNRGYEHYCQQQYDDAIKDYNTEIILHPNYPECYLNRGNAYMGLNNYDSAIKDYTTALQIDTNYKSVFINRGNTYVKMKKYKEAISDYNLAIRNNIYLALAYNNLGNVYYKLQQYDSAISDYDSTIHLKPNDLAPYFNRALSYKGLGKFSEAANGFTAAIRIDPGNAEAYFNRGLAYSALAKYNDAISDYTSAVTLMPGYWNAFFSRGIAWYALGKYDEAMKDYDQTIMLNPNYAEAYNNRAGVYFALKQYDNAIKDYISALRINPGYFDMYKNISVCYSNMGDNQQARAYLQQYNRAAGLAKN